MNKAADRDIFVAGDIVPVNGRSMIRAYSHDGKVHLTVGGNVVALEKDAAKQLVAMIDAALK